MQPADPSVQLRRTPLYAAHQRLGGRIVEFGGWEMPVQYASIVEEHLAVRKAAGLFDISHMGEMRATGASAESFLNQVLTNDVKRLAPGQGQYTLMCNECGGVIDDLYVYRLDASDYLLIINASRIEPDVAWLQRRWSIFDERDAVSLKDTSGETGALAVQGPRVAEFIDSCFSSPSSRGAAVERPSLLAKNQIAQFGFSESVVWVGRTGYTGEDGFEVVAPSGVVEPLWERLVAAGTPRGLKPAGLGARDTLRTEMCYPLYGHELDENTTPIEAGLGFFVSLNKGEFVGRTVLAQQKEKGVGKKLVAFKLTERAAPPRPHYAIWSAGPNAARVGIVTSGTQSPSLGIGVGMGYVKPEYAKLHTALGIEIRGKCAAAVSVSKPIYRKPD